MDELDRDLQHRLKRIAERMPNAPEREPLMLRAARLRRRLVAAVSVLGLVLVVGGIAGASMRWTSGMQVGEPGDDVGGGGASVSAPTAIEDETYPAPYFIESKGWYTESSGDVGATSGLQATAWASNGPFLPEQSTAGYPRNTVSTMPEHGIVIVATLPLPDRYPAATTNPNFSSRGQRIQLSEAEHLRTWEGQPRPEIPQFRVLGVIKEQYVDVRVYFGRQDPTRTQLRAAQEELRHLVIPDRA